MVKKNYRLKIEDIVLLIIPLLFLLLLIKPQGEVKKPPQKVGQEKEFTGSGLDVWVYHPRDNVIVQTDLEEYLVGVLAAEMPPSFEKEALKAQAVAARTYALGRIEGLYGTRNNHYGADICTDSTHCQAWISKERFMEIYGTEEDWKKIEDAVAETKNIVMTYDGVVINPLYHSNSGGVTEDVEQVWAVSGHVPYLKSVYSPDESTYPDYEKKVLLSWDDIKKKVKTKYPKARFKQYVDEDMEIKSYTVSGRVASIRIGSIEMEGPEFRDLFSLRSTNLEISFPSNTSVEITTRGYGHGVGMSQCGADVLAKDGYSFNDILEYYYTGISIGEIGQ